MAACAFLPQITADYGLASDRAEQVIARRPSSGATYAGKPRGGSRTFCRPTDRSGLPATDTHSGKVGSRLHTLRGKTLSFLRFAR